MESSLKIPPSAPYYMAVNFNHFFWKKRTIFDYYITFYEIYLDINFTLWYRILLHFLNKNQGGTLMVFSKFVYKIQNRIWSMAMDFLEISEMFWFLTGIYVKKLTPHLTPHLSIIVGFYLGSETCSKLIKTKFQTLWSKKHYEKKWFWNNPKGTPLHFIQKMQQNRIS